MLKQLVITPLMISVLSCTHGSRSSSNVKLAGGSSSQGPGNPRSIVCGYIGGKTLTATDKNNQYIALCKVDEAILTSDTLMQSVEQREMQQALVLFAQRDRPSSANEDSYCADVGGKFTEALDTQSSNVLSFCSFPDKSMIGLETLVKGSDAPGMERMLAEILKLRDAWQNFGDRSIIENEDESANWLTQNIFGRLDVSKQVTDTTTIFKANRLTCAKDPRPELDATCVLTYGTNLSHTFEHADANALYQILARARAGKADSEGIDRIVATEVECRQPNYATSPALCAIKINL